MDINPGFILSVGHYSLLNVFKCIVRDVQNDSITVRLPKEALKTTYLIGDPLVVAYEKPGSDDIEIIGGRVTDVDTSKEMLVFSEDQPDEGVKMRYYERYPVSLYADFRLAEGGKKCYALIKDISEYGMLIYTNESFFKGQKLNFDVYLARDILSLTAEIVRKTDCNGYFEYGLRIRHNGPVVFNHIKNFVRKTKEEHSTKFIKV